MMTMNTCEVRGQTSYDPRWECEGCCHEIVIAEVRILAGDIISMTLHVVRSLAREGQHEIKQMDAPALNNRIIRDVFAPSFGDFVHTPI